MKLTEKFSHIKYLDNIKRFRGIEKTRFNKIRLDANERVSNFSEKFLLNFKRKINSNYLTAYPETEQIYKLLAKNYGMSPKNYFITAGSDIGIRHCFELFVKKGSNIICLDPTFGMYNVYSKIFRNKKQLVKRIFWLFCDIIVGPGKKATPHFNLFSVQ